MNIPFGKCSNRQKWIHPHIPRNQRTINGIKVVVPLQSAIKVSCLAKQAAAQRMIGKEVGVRLIALEQSSSVVAVVRFVVAVEYFLRSIKGRLRLIGPQCNLTLSAVAS